MNDLENRHQRQLRREAQFQDDAKRLLQKRLGKALLHSQPALQLVTKYWQPLSTAIKEKQKQIVVSKRTVTKPWRFILALNAECLAYYTLTTIIESQRWDEIVHDREVDDEADTDEQASEPNPKIGDDANVSPESSRALPSDAKSFAYDSGSPDCAPMRISLDYLRETRAGFRHRPLQEGLPAAHSKTRGREDEEDPQLYMAHDKQ